MASNVTRMTPQQTMPVPGTQDGNWVWDGSQWTCNTCDGGGGFPFCPPSGYPPGGCPPWYSGQNSPPWYPGANAGVSFGTTAPLNPVRGHFWWNGFVLAMFDGAAWVNTTNGAIIGSGGGAAGTSGVVISATAPGNPVPGMQWWDGSVMRVFDSNGQWKIVGPGGAAGPVPTTTKAFALKQATTLTIAPTTWSIVPFVATPSIDPFVGWNATTHAFKPTRAGTYQFFIRAYFNSPGAGWNAMNLLKNDQGTYNPVNLEQVAETQLYSGAAPASAVISASGITLMDGATDFVRLWAYAVDGNILNQGFSNIEAYLLP